jgi:hypothetical protein
MQGSSAKFLQGQALLNLYQRAYARLDRKYTHRVLSETERLQIDNLISTFLQESLTRTYKTDLIGASILVIITAEDLFEKSDELVKKSTYITSGQELAITVAQYEQAVVNTKCKADGIIYYQVVYNHENDVIRGVMYSFDPSRQPPLNTPDDYYQMGKRIAKDRIPENMIQDMSKFMYNVSRNPELRKQMVDCFQNIEKESQQPFSRYMANKSRSCAHCNVVCIHMKKCSQCGNAYYCQESCQRAHWAKHKKECVKTK